MRGERIVEEFARKYYDLVTSRGIDGTWLGVPVLKCPFDLWVYQEIIFEVQPDLIIECGTYLGGCSLFMASVLDLINKGRVVTVDIVDRPIPNHPRITKVVGDSISERTFALVENYWKPGMVTIVVLNSDHHKDHVLRELEIYSRYVSKGSYLIVEDTSVGHTVRPDFGPGPMEAVEEFLERPDVGFEIDRNREKFLLTFNPRGYLRRV